MPADLKGVVLAFALAINGAVPAAYPRVTQAAREAGWEFMVHGFHEDLNVAMRQASLEMLRLLTDLKGTSRNDAYSLMSVAADFTVTQVVDGRQGIHARIPRSVFPPKK